MGVLNFFKKQNTNNINPLNFAILDLKVSIYSKKVLDLFILLKLNLNTLNVSVSLGISN
jgi:hypothetical protein